MDTFQRDDLPQGNIFLIVASRHLLLLSHLIVCHLNYEAVDQLRCVGITLLTVATVPTTLPIAETLFVLFKCFTCARDALRRC